MKKKKFIVPFILFLAMGITMFLGWQKKQISLEEVEIEKEVVQLEQKENEKEEQIEKKIISRPEVTVSEIVALILREGMEVISYSSIELDGRSVIIKGRTDGVEDLYRLESNLRSYGAHKINYDYIKREKEALEFTMDFSLENYRSEKSKVYSFENRKMFATPTDKRIILSGIISERSEILSVGRTTKSDFSDGIIMVSAPYHIKGDIHEILNLFFEIEESHIFLSLLSDPIKIVISGDDAEAYFKVTGYSGSFS
ncbi:MAG: hypothetical protein ACRCZ2_03145 [Fusobacteriaceae bacterium]